MMWRAAAARLSIISVSMQASILASVEYYGKEYITDEKYEKEDMTDSWLFSTRIDRRDESTHLYATYPLTSRSPKPSFSQHVLSPSLRDPRHRRSDVKSLRSQRV